MGKISSAREDTTYSSEGTMAAWAAERVLTGVEPDLLDNLADAGLPPEWAPHLRGYVQFVRDRVTGDGQLLVENKVPMFYDPLTKGTYDARVWTGDVLHIIDLKFGVGVSVEAQDNDQLVCYAASEASRLGLTSPSLPVEMSIYQPRCSSGPVERVWRTTLGHVLERAATIAKAHTKVLLGDVHFAASDKGCQFCEARKLCRARAQWLSGSKDPASVGDPPHPLPEEMSEEEMIRIGQKVVLGHFTKWLNGVEEYLTEQLRQGKTLKGLKLVETAGRRAWTDEATAKAKLLALLPRDEVIKEAIVSPSQAEKALGKKTYETVKDLVAKGPGGIALALEVDKRPAWKPVDINKDFADVVEDSGL
jgi:hypothetical protein